MFLLTYAGPPLLPLMLVGFKPGSNLNQEALVTGFGTNQDINSLFEAGVRSWLVLVLENIVSWFRQNRKTSWFGWCALQKEH